MKARHFHSILLVAGLFLVTTAIAQEGDLQPPEVEVVPIQPQQEIYDSEQTGDGGEFRSYASGTLQQGALIRESESSPRPAVKPNKAVVEPSKAAEKKEDVLSFNFLYYFIQKFKMSDIIDE